MNLFQRASSLNEILRLKDDPDAGFSEETRKAHAEMCSRRLEEVKLYEKRVEKRHQEWVALAEKAGALTVCLCCYSDDCLEEEMVPCQVSTVLCCFGTLENGIPKFLSLLG